MQIRPLVRVVGVDEVHGKIHARDRLDVLETLLFAPCSRAFCRRLTALVRRFDFLLFLLCFLLLFAALLLFTRFQPGKLQRFERDLQVLVGQDVTDTLHRFKEAVDLFVAGFRCGEQVDKLHAGEIRRDPLLAAAAPGANPVAACFAVRHVDFKVRRRSACDQIELLLIRIALEQLVAVRAADRRDLDAHLQPADGERKLRRQRVEDLLRADGLRIAFCFCFLHSFASPPL